MDGLGSALQARHADVSVVIVSYECRELLMDCLRSLERERDDVQFETMLVDNASQDGTVDVVRDGFPWVDVMEAGGNLGFARSNNLALARLKRRGHVLLLNPDTTLEPGALADCVAQLEASPEVGLLGCKLVQPSGELDHACKRGFPTLGRAAAYFTGLSRLFPHDPKFAGYTAGAIGDDETSDVDAVNGAFMLIRGEAFEDVGLLDERFWMYGEDLDYCWRIWSAGWKVRYWPGATVTHVKGGSSTKARSWNSNRAFHHAMLLFYDKHLRSRYPRGVRTLVRAAVVGKLAVSASRSAARRRVATVVGG